MLLHGGVLKARNSCFDLVGPRDQEAGMGVPKKE